jgi:arabinogalactan endo-1,4-beta-galactosidase
VRSPQRIGVTHGFRMRPTTLLVCLVAVQAASCGGGDADGGSAQPPQGGPSSVRYTFEQLCLGADLSYVNQVEDHGGTYRDAGEVRDPFRILRDRGANLVRVRLWHDPQWTKTVYGSEGTQLYSDIADVEKTVRRAKQQGMAVALDLHCSDTWADPSHQAPPAAWRDVPDLATLKARVYAYTHEVVSRLNAQGLMPEMVQIGNEINCGLLITDVPAGFPDLNACRGRWAELGAVLNEGIRAVRAVSAGSSVKTLIALHVADPKNVEWWFDNITSAGGVTDFDVVGFSYYPLWHTSVAYEQLPALVTRIVNRYGRKVMILETAYPWTSANADGYANLFGSQAALPSFPFTVDGQRSFLTDQTQKMIAAGASGIIYWEPAWITSRLKDPWGTGSAWDNVTLFDFNGNALASMEYLTHPYTFPPTK